MGAYVRTLTFLATAMLAALLMAGCGGRIAGVRFSEESEGTEFFKTLWLTGEGIVTPAGGASPCSNQGGGVWTCTGVTKLTVNMGITNGYPVPVRVACYYEDPDTVTDDQEKLTFHERAKLIGERVLAAREGRRPDEGKDDAKELPEETLSFPFDAPPPGKYFLACLTPAAADNGLGLDFTIAP